MLKSLMFGIAKKYLIGSMNELLEKNKDNVAIVCSQIQTWTARLTSLILLLNQISDKCSDGKIEDNEVNDCLSKIEEVIRSWK